MSEPVYQRIAADLRNRIASGEAVPSISAIAREYHCERPTARKAFDLLKREGILGDDGRVIEHKPVTLRVSDEESITFIADLIAAGHVTAPPEIAVKIEGDRLVREVLRKVDGEPHNFARWVFPLEIAQGTRLAYDVDIPDGSVWYVKEALGWTELAQEKHLEARMPTAAETAVLGMNGGPVIVEHREGSQDGTRLFASVRILRADRTRLVP